jgi:hypothetical protein
MLGADWEVTMNEVLIFALSFLVPLLAWAGVIVGAVAWRLRYADVGPVKFAVFGGIPFSLGLMPITQFTYWAMEAWA